MRALFNCFAILTVFILLVFPIKPAKAAISSLTITGSNISSQTVGTSQTTTVSLSFLSGSPYFDEEEVIFDFAGFSVNSTISLANVSLIAPIGCTNSIEAWPGTPGNSTHELRLSNNNISDNDPVLILSIDNGTSCGAGTWTATINSGLTSYATPGNYSPAVYTPEGGGSTTLYVGGANQVEVNATVSQDLTFSIRNSADTSGFSSCNLGNLSAAGVQTCSYRLKVSTLQDYRIIIDSDGGLRKSNGANIDYVTDGTVSNNIEEYGLSINLGTLTSGQPLNTGPSWSTGTDNNPLPAEVGSEIINADGGNSPSTTDTNHTHLITHKAEAGANTEVGSYSQNIVYTALPDF
ncbi:MAG: hypothetical protein ACOCXP_01305 [Candidatus Dojkabacteria bacterium]